MRSQCVWLPEPNERARLHWFWRWKTAYLQSISEAQELTTAIQGLCFCLVPILSLTPDTWLVILPYPVGYWSHSLVCMHSIHSVELKLTFFGWILLQPNGTCIFVQLKCLIHTARFKGHIINIDILQEFRDKFLQRCCFGLIWCFMVKKLESTPNTSLVNRKMWDPLSPPSSCNRNLITSRCHFH